MLLYVRIDRYEHDMRGSRSRRTSWSFLDGGTSQGDLPPLRRSCDFGISHHGEEIGRVEPQQATADHAFGHGARLSKIGYADSGQEAGRQAGAQRPSSCATGADRPKARTSIPVLSGLPRAAKKLCEFPHGPHRGYPRRDNAGGYGTYDPSRLVPAVQEAGRTEGSRRLAWGYSGQPHSGDDRLDALRPGQLDFADCRCLQLSLADEADPWRAGEPLATPSRHALSLVRTDPGGSLEIRRVARRRDLVAGVRQDPLAVGLCQSRPDLLHDRPLPRRTGTAAVFHRGI